MSELVEFLTARLDEREERAECIHDTSCGMLRYDGTCDCGEPERVRAEVEAKQRRIELHGAGPHECVDWDEALGETCTCYEVDCLTLLLEALPDAGHPNFKEKWRV